MKDLVASILIASVVLAGLMACSPSPKAAAEEVALRRAASSCIGVTYDAEVRGMRASVSGNQATVKGEVRVVFTSGGRQGEGPFNDAYYGHSGRRGPFTCSLSKYDGEWEVQSFSWGY